MIFFNKDKGKVVPDSNYNLLTPMALAHWIMGDRVNLNKGLVWCTDSFTLQEVVKLMNNKAHLSIQGLNKIINIKASMNLGLSDFLKSEFTKFAPVPFLYTKKVRKTNY